MPYARAFWNILAAIVLCTGFVAVFAMYFGLLALPAAGV